MLQPLGSLCDDGNKCTESDRCNAIGQCVGMPRNADDGNPCTSDACDPASGALIHAAETGKPCDDGDLCTDGDKCDASGKCAGSPLDIDDSNECTVDLCDPTTGNIDHKGKSGCGACQTSDDCNDNNPCTNDSCKNGLCDYQDAPAGASCDDGNKCTTGDKCDASGKCAGVSKNVDDGNPCTNDACDPASGNPVYTPAPGKSCSDGNACTDGDKCDGSGQCVGTPKSVDDGNECTTDACDPTTGNVSHAPAPGCQSCTSNADCNDNNPCTNDLCDAGKCAYTSVAQGAKCDDGNKCTTGDACDGGGQCAGVPKNVDDGNPCTSDACDPASGNPVYTPSSGASCNDGNACTLGDQCDVGVCKGTPKSVDDGNECTTDACDPASGNVSHTPLPNCKPCSVAADCNDNNPCTNDSCQAGKCAYTNASSGASCSDNNPCTDNDKCNGSGQCVGTPKACNSPPNACHQGTGVCNQANGICSYAFLSNGTACSDGNACTTNDTCQNGTCVGGVGKSCSSPPNACYNSPGTCDTTTGACNYPVKVNGTACSDGNACTTGDTCQNGACVGGLSKTCNSGGECYQSSGTCNTTSGLCEYPYNNGAPCDDGIFCTKNDACFNGSCQGNWKPGCNEP
jgi:hypothetical protein